MFNKWRTKYGWRVLKLHADNAADLDLRFAAERDIADAIRTALTERQAVISRLERDMLAVISQRDSRENFIELVAEAIMKQIELTKGLYALVNDEDFGPLSQYEWTAGWAGTRYYAKRWDVLEQKNIYMHRQILGHPTSMIDHTNGNSLDNRRSNLRFCNHSTNAHNGKMRRGSSKYRGVVWDKRKAK